MAVRLEVAGGQYCDAMPGGAYAALVPTQYQDFPDGSFVVTQAGRIETHLGPIAIPAAEVAARGQGPLMLRCTDVGGGGFQLCGKPHAFPGTWSWRADTGLWTLNPTDSCGVSGHIFDLTGALFISTCAPPYGSQGFRYVNDANVIISGDATYADLARQLYEYSEYDCGATHVAIGQGPGTPGDFGGVHAVTGVPGVSTLRRYTLEVGFKWFVRFKHAGTSISVAIFSVDTASSIFHWFEVDELTGGAPGGPVQGGGGVAATCV